MPTPLPYPGPDDNRGPELLAIIWVFTAAALIIVTLKLYTRYSIIRQTGLDDLLIFFATTLVLLCTILFTVDVHYGMGRHTYYLSPSRAVQAVRMNYIANPFGIMAYSIPNISIAIFINRILVPPRWQAFCLYALAIAQNTIAAISCILLFVQCTPTASLWNPAIAPTSCLDAYTLTHYSYFVGAFTAFTDVVLAVVPIVAFRRLQMKLKPRIAVSILMGFTLCAAVCAIVKTSKLDELAEVSDFTYATVDLIITAVVEADVIIIASCIPSLRPFARSVNESISSQYMKRLGHGSNSSSRFSKRWLQLSMLGQSGQSRPSDRGPSATASRESFPLPHTSSGISATEVV